MWMSHHQTAFLTWNPSWSMCPSPRLSKQIQPHLTKCGSSGDKISTPCQEKLTIQRQSVLWCMLKPPSNPREYSRRDQRDRLHTSHKFFMDSHDRHQDQAKPQVFPQNFDKHIQDLRLFHQKHGQNLNEPKLFKLVAGIIHDGGAPIGPY